MIAELIHRFFEDPPSDCGALTNERALQLELALFLRKAGFCVQFEVPSPAPRLPASTLRPKYNLDLLIESEKDAVGIELKVPMNGQHPETMYAFCADIEFIESLKRSGSIQIGYCLIATNDPVFWRDSGRGSPIHNAFRAENGVLSGIIQKPTGLRDTCVQLESFYRIASAWRSIGSDKLLQGGKYALVAV